MRQVLGSLLLVLCCSVQSIGQSYNDAVYGGLDSMVDSLITADQAEHFKEEAELLLIFNEVNHQPCSHTIVFIMVESEKGKPIKKFNMTIGDYRGLYDYSSMHKNELASIWIDETFDQIGNYKVTIHEGVKIKSSDVTSTFRIKNKECNFIFKKMIVQ